MIGLPLVFAIILFYGYCKHVDKARRRLMEGDPIYRTFRLQAMCRDIGDTEGERHASHRLSALCSSELVMAVEREPDVFTDRELGSVVWHRLQMIDHSCAQCQDADVGGQIHRPLVDARRRGLGEPARFITDDMRESE